MTLSIDCDFKSLEKCKNNQIIFDKNHCFCGIKIATQGEHCSTGSINGVITQKCINKNAVCDMKNGDCKVVQKCMCGPAKLSSSHICTNVDGAPLPGYDSPCSDECGHDLVCDNLLCKHGEGSVCRSVE